MLIATALLFTIGVLGAADILIFHTIKGQLVRRPECRREAVIHVLRGFVYAAQFIVIPGYRFTGAWFWALVALFVIDISIAVTDVWEEPKSRASQGGLSSAEYLMHIGLSVDFHRPDDAKHQACRVKGPFVSAGWLRVPVS